MYRSSFWWGSNSCCMNTGSNVTSSKISDVEGIVLILFRCFCERFRCRRQTKKKGGGDYINAAGQVSKATSKKVEKKGCPYTRHEGVWRDGITAPFIPKLGTRWRSMVSSRSSCFTLGECDSGDIWMGANLVRESVWLFCRSGNYFASSGNWTTIFRLSARNEIDSWSHLRCIVSCSCSLQAAGYQICKDTYFLVELAQNQIRKKLNTAG